MSSNQRERFRYDLLSLLTTVMLLLIPFNTALAQSAPIQSKTEPYFLDSGRHSGAQGKDARSYVGFNEIVWVSGAPWIRLTFSRVSLGEKSYIQLTSLEDGATQFLDAKSLATWKNTSAYFNGDAVEVILHVAPGDRDVNFQIDELVVGDYASSTRSICGSTDDRTPSNDPAVGRIVPVGCTGWITQHGNQVTAGHCIGASTDVLQFNVPASSASGTIQHPAPQDQYPIDSNSFVFTNGDVGNDWAVFDVQNNAQTNLQPIQAQAAFFNLAQSLSAATLRITGYGVAAGTLNQTQQTHAGPNTGSSGTTLRYRADTMGGNSGSPVIDTSTGLAVGVHTHGGCTLSGGNNNGTSTFNSSFWAALAPPPAPGAPTQLTPDRLCNGSYRLTWNPPAGGNVQQYQLYRSSNTSFSPQFLWWSGSTTSTTVNAGSSGTWYARIRACNQSGCGPYSNTATLPGFSGCH